MSYIAYKLCKQMLIHTLTQIYLWFVSIKYIDHASRENKLLAKITPIFMEILCFSTYLVPVAEIALLIRDPYMPPFLCSILKSYLTSTSKVSCICIVKIGIISFDAYMQFRAFCGGSIWIIFIFFAGVVALLNYLQFVER